MREDAQRDERYLVAADPAGYAGLPWRFRVKTNAGDHGNPKLGASQTRARYEGNSTLILSRSCMRRIASPKSGATETTSTLEDSATGCVSIESVTTRPRIGPRSRRSIDPSPNTPCDTAA